MEKIKLSRADKGFLYALLIANKEKSADELFNEQEFYLDTENQGIMIYSNYYDTEIWFLKEKEEIELGGRNPKLTPKLVLTINKKCAELQWYESLERRRIRDKRIVRR